MSSSSWVKCGHELTAQVASTQPPQTGSRKGGGLLRVGIIALLILLVLVLPVFPRDRVVYVDGTTQTVTISTSYNTLVSTFSSQAAMQISVYQGTLEYIPDVYYNIYFNYQNYGYYSYPYYYNSYPYCPYGCSNPPYYYNYPYYWGYPSYNSYNYGYRLANTITVKPTDNVVKVQQSQQSNGFYTLTLTHYDDTSITYNHVFQQSLAQSGTSTVQGSTTATNTITNSVVNPVTNTVACHQCIPQHVTEHVSLLQLILGY